jgi:putative membrane protein
MRVSEETAMRRPVIVSIGFAAALLCSASAGWAGSKAGQKFITTAIQGNLAEVSMGQLAQQNGQSDGIKSYGQQLVKDHSDAHQKAVAAANTLGVTPPTEPTKKQKADYERMAKLSGAKFDQAFARHMARDHNKEIKAYERAAKMRKADAAATYASDTLPTLKQHLETAKELSKGGGKSM